MDETRGSMTDTPQHYCRRIYVVDGHLRICMLWPDHAAPCGGTDD